MSSKRSSSALNRRVSANPRFQHIKPVVDSGSTIRKYVESVEDKHRHYKLGKDEIFRRIKLDSFVKLVIEVGMNTLHSENTEITHDDPELMKKSEKLNLEQHEQQVMTARSTLCSVISGIGELDLNKPDTNLQINHEALICQDIKTPYLLLDVRDADAYNKNHIISAINYPHTMVSRAMNYETKELLLFKNKPGCIIVIYDDDEILSQKVITTLVQRGYENIYLLSGGLKLAMQKFRDGFIVMDAKCLSATDAQRNEFTIDDIQRLKKSVEVYAIPKTASFPHKESSEKQQRKVSPLTNTRLLRKPWK